MRKVYSLAVLTGLAGCSSLTPADDPVYLRITDVEARLIRIERVLENDSLISLAGDIASLRTEVQQLLGEVETLQFELDNQAEGNRDLYLDLDQRLQALEAAQQRLASLPTSPGGPSAGALTDQQAYDAALALVDQRDFPAAQAAFESFLASYRASDLRANAQYWLAETHYGQLSFGTALREFQRVIDDYPQSNKFPDALLKIGYSNQQLGNTAAAREALLRVVREFPGTSMATLAQQRLDEISGGR